MFLFTDLIRTSKVDVDLINVIGTISDYSFEETISYCKVLDKGWLSKMWQCQWCSCLKSLWCRPNAVYISHSKRVVLASPDIHDIVWKCFSSRNNYETDENVR